MKALHGIVYTWMVLVLAAAPAFGSVVERCPYNPATSTGLLSTAGCVSSSTQGLLDSDMSFDFARFSHEHVFGLIQEFVWEIRDFKDTVMTHQREWILAHTDVPSSTYELNPTARNTSSLTNTRATNKHRILRELRWWLTAIESGLQLVHSTGQLGPRPGYLAACEAAMLSSRLHSLLRIFSVDLDTLPSQAGCRQTQPINTDSHTERVALVSIILRDTVYALTRIDDVISDCQIRSHTSGHHRVRLHCGPHVSLFQQDLERDSDFQYYHFQHLVDRLRSDD